MRTGGLKHRRGYGVRMYVGETTEKYKNNVKIIKVNSNMSQIYT